MTMKAVRTSGDWVAQTSAASVRNPRRPQPLIQQLAERRHRFGLPFRRDVLNERLDCAFDQDAQDGIWVHADRAAHGDGLGEDVQRVRPVSGHALNSTDKCLNGWEWTVWHIPRMRSGWRCRRTPLR
jgi:hypothetical protein